MNSEEIYTQTSSASAGEPQYPDTEAVRARAEAPSLLRPEVLDERQERFRDKRRTGGPSIEEESGAEGRGATVEPVDVPPTDCQNLAD